jgi:tetratricopeptide (TPR) repeat protein
LARAAMRSLNLNPGHMNTVKEQCLVISNCQGYVLRDLLNLNTHFARHFHVNLHRNYLPGGNGQRGDVKSKLILRQSVSSSAIEDSVEKYLERNSEDDCTTILFPNYYSTIYWPATASFDLYNLHDRNIFAYVAKGATRKEALAGYLLTSISEEEVSSHLESSIEIERAKESRTGVRYVDYLLDNYRGRQLFYLDRHPDKTLMLIVANYVLGSLGLDKLSEDKVGDYREFYHDNSKPIDPDVYKHLKLRFNGKLYVNRTLCKTRYFDFFYGLIVNDYIFKSYTALDTKGGFPQDTGNDGSCCSTTPTDMVSFARNCGVENWQKKVCTRIEAVGFHNCLAEGYERQCLYEKAKEHYVLAFKCDNTDTRSLVKLFQLLYRQRRVPEYAAILRSIKNVDYPKYLECKMSIALDRNRHREALGHLDRLSLLQGIDVYIAPMATSIGRLSGKDAALKFIRGHDHYALDPYRMEMIAGNVLMDLFDYEGARRIFEKLESTNKTDSQVVQKLALCLRKTGNTRQSVALLEGAVAEDYFYARDALHLIKELAVGLHMVGMPEKALDVLCRTSSRIVQFDPVHDWDIVKKIDAMLSSDKIRLDQLDRYGNMLIIKASPQVVYDYFLSLAQLGVARADILVHEGGCRDQSRNINIHPCLPRGMFNYAMHGHLIPAQVLSGDYNLIVLLGSVYGRGEYDNFSPLLDKFKNVKRCIFTLDNLLHVQTKDYAIVQ